MVLYSDFILKSWRITGHWCISQDHLSILRQGPQHPLTASNLLVVKDDLELLILLLPSS